MNLIEELYFGTISPSTSIDATSPAYQKAMKLTTSNEEYLTSALKDGEKRLFLELLDAHSTILGELSLAHFQAGFRLGARLMDEVGWDKVQGYLRE